MSACVVTAPPPRCGEGTRKLSDYGKVRTREKAINRRTWKFNSIKRMREPPSVRVYFYSQGGGGGGYGVETHRKTNKHDYNISRLIK